MTYGLPLASTMYRYGIGGSVAGVILAVLGPMVPLAVFILMPFFEQISLNLSGGQKKMVAIARAMALSPSILLLDEAFEGLAPVVVNRFIEAVKRIKDMGISVLIAESNLMTATRVADRLYAIDRGEIIFEGDPQSALRNEDVMKTIRG